MITYIQNMRRFRFQTLSVLHSLHTKHEKEQVMTYDKEDIEYISTITGH